jgi:hypothetical protein
LFVRRDWVFTFAAFLPALLTVLVLLSLDRNLWPRLFFSEIGFVALFTVTALIAAGDYLESKLTPNRLSLTLGVTVLPALLLCLASASTLPKLYKYPKQDYQGAMDFVEQLAAPADSILGMHMAGRIYQLYYAPEWPAVDTVEEVLKYRSERGYTWILYTLPRYIKQAKPEVSTMLETEFEIVRVFPGALSDGEIIVSRSKLQPMEKQ